MGDREERLISPELQAERIEEFARARGLEVEMLPPELDVSGGKLKRPILESALQRIEAGEAAGLIVAQLDRLSRLSLVDAYKIIDRIEDAGAQVIAVAENFDATTPEGEMGRNMMLSLARMQRRRYSDQFASAKERAVRHGIWPISRVPYGYCKGEGRRLAPDENAPKVRRAFELRASGAPWSEVTQIIDRALSGAIRLIANRVYLGEIHYGEWSNLKAHEPIVDRALWEAAQSTTPRPPRSKLEPALLAGIIRCAGCRGLLTRDASGRNPIYRCVSNRAAGKCPSPAIITCRLVDEYVERSVLAHIRNLGFAERPDEGALAEAEQGLEIAEAELAAFQQATSALSGDFAEGLRIRAEAVERARREVVAARLASEPIVPGEAIELWPTLSVLERRQLLRRSLGVVWVRKGRGPISERVKIASDIPPDLPRSGPRRYEITPINWEDVEDLAVPGAEDFRDPLSGTGL